MSLKKKIYSRKGITTLAIIMAVLVVGSGIVASKKGIFADTTQSPELTASALQASGTDKMIFKAAASVDVSYFNFWWNCPALPEDVTEAQLVARCGQPQIVTINSVTQQQTTTGDLAKGVRPIRHSKQAAYEKTLPSAVTNGKFVVFAKGTGTVNYRKTVTYNSGVRTLVAYNSTSWHVSALNIVSSGTRFLIESLNDSDGNVPLRRFTVWYNCNASALTADEDTLGEVKAICGNPDQNSTQYANRYAFNHLFTTFVASRMVVVVDQQHCAAAVGNATPVCQWQDTEPAKLVAKVDYTPANLTPTPTPSLTTPAVTLAQSPSATNPKAVTFSAHVTDAKTTFANTHFTFWWNCTGTLPAQSAVTYTTMKTACGDTSIFIGGTKTNNASDSIGRRYQDQFLGSKAAVPPTNTILNDKASTYTYPASGPMKAIVLVERTGRAPVYRTLTFTVGAAVTPSATVTASNTPMPSATVTASNTTTVTPTATATTINRTLVHGYNVFGAAGKLLPSAFTAKGMSPVWGFNTPEKPSMDPKYSAIWNRYPTDSLEFAMKAGNAYYVYNQGASKTVALQVAPENVNNRELRPGWNLVWSDKAQALSAMSGTLYSSTSSLQTPGETNKCIRNNVSLKDLVDKGIAYDNVYIIQQANASASSSLAPECQIFRLLGATAKTNANCTVDRTNNTISNMGSVTQVPANKGLWFYIFPSRVGGDDRTDTLTTGSQC